MQTHPPKKIRQVLLKIKRKQSKAFVIEYIIFHFQYDLVFKLFNCNAVEMHLAIDFDPRKRAVYSGNFSLSQSVITFVAGELYIILVHYWMSPKSLILLYSFI